MNLLLHGIGSQEGEPIEVTDSLRADPAERFQVVLTNPPFGKKSSFTVLARIIHEHAEPKRREHG